MSLYPGDSPDNPNGHATGLTTPPASASGSFVDGIGAAVGVKDKTTQRIVGVGILIAGLALVGLLILRARGR